MSVSVEERYHVPSSQTWEGSRGRQRGNLHLHVLEPLVRGRYSRKAGECLCPKKHGSYERPAEDWEIRCVRCADIAERYGIAWPSEIRRKEHEMSKGTRQ